MRRAAWATSAAVLARRARLMRGRCCLQPLAAVCALASCGHAGRTEARGPPAAAWLAPTHGAQLPPADAVLPRAGRALPHARARWAAQAAARAAGSGLQPPLVRACAAEPRGRVFMRRFS